VLYGGVQGGHVRQQELEVGHPLAPFRRLRVLDRACKVLHAWHANRRFSTRLLVTHSLDGALAHLGGLLSERDGVGRQRPQTLKERRDVEARAEVITLVQLVRQQTFLLHGRDHMECQIAPHV
jgi:hypothetical protein